MHPNKMVHAPMEYPIEYQSDEDDVIRESGAGILEFTPAKAGMDMTPANFNFESKDDKKKLTTSGLSSLAGEIFASVLFFVQQKT